MTSITMKNFRLSSANGRCGWFWTTRQLILPVDGPPTPPIAASGSLCAPKSPPAEVSATFCRLLSFKREADVHGRYSR